jgi:hypothetical protein
MACIIGIEPIAYDYGDGAYSEFDTRIAYRRAVAAGPTQVSHAQSWPELEPTQGNYDLSDFELLLEETGAADVQVTVPIVDHSGNKVLPSYLSGLAFDHATVQARFAALLQRFNDLTGSSRIKVFIPGTEVESRFQGTQGEIAAYATLIAGGLTAARGMTGWSAIEFGASFKHDQGTAMAAAGLFRSIVTAGSVPIITHYPVSSYIVNPAHRTAVAADSATASFADLYTGVIFPLASGILISEWGLPSHADCSSSEAYQAAYVQGMLALMVELGASTVGGRPAVGRANQVWQTDLNDEALDFYDLEGIARAFIGSLGLVAEDGRQKASWAALVSGCGGVNIPDGTSVALGSAVYRPTVAL